MKNGLHSNGGNRGITGVVAVTVAIFLLTMGGSLFAQSWEFAKEKDGIRIYTKKAPGSNLKAYRGEAAIMAPTAKVFALIEDVHHTDWWDKNLNQIEVLQYQRFRSARYYLVYDLPWPVADRDLCVDVNVNYNPATGGGSIMAKPLAGAVAEKSDKIRIREYRQTWMVEPAGKDRSKVVLEGFVDPAGSIPDWLINMLIVDSPYKIIKGVKERMEK